jgi:hypothetical protein
MQLTTKLRLLGGVAVLATACYGDTINLVTTAAAFTSAAPGTNDSILWNQLGSDGTTISHVFSVNTTGGKATQGSYLGTTGLVSVACPHAPQCSWGPVTNVPAGDTLNWAFDPNGNGGNGIGTGPITINTPQGYGAGAIFSADVATTFTAKLDLFNGSTDLGSVTVTSDSSGDAVFIGALDATGANITHVVFSLQSISGGGDLGDFAIDTVLLKNQATVTTGSPEPASLFLAGGALLALGWMRKRRAGQNS